MTCTALLLPWILLARLIVSQCTDTNCTTVRTETVQSKVIETFTSRMRCEDVRTVHAHFYGFSVVPSTQDRPLMLRKELTFTCEQGERP